MSASETPADGARTRDSRLARIFRSGFTAFLVLAVLVAAISAKDSTFLGVDNLKSLLDQGSPLILLAYAQALIVFTGRINLANASLSSLFGVVLALELGKIGGLAIPLVLVIATAVGLAIGWVHVATQVPSFIVSLGALGIASGLALWASKADSVLVDKGYGAVEWVTYQYYGIPFSFLVVLVVTAILMVMFALLPFGRNVFACGMNERAAAYSGVRTNLQVTILFGMSALLSALAALIGVGQLQSTGAYTFDTYLLPSIAAVVVGGSSIAGGVGGIGRTLLGALVITVLRVGFDVVGIKPAWQPILYGAIVIAAIAFTVDRRQGGTVA